ncbi:TrkA C-terminal domain-containing protein [Clostridium butyricum]|uniref:TrkA C-terminal domain-containing protein n=1 Tax=Clostridium butyricum TaxID=1492 RepID=UPI0005C1B628|nr:TrkA C-terminal domain-containing protein [Clostridium butyricum]KIU06628.1 GntR-family transcriptional regulator [Clostridium butyricum]MBA8966465.1 K+/H+ antiporter YhaU regulatory subunit KhtT [Clostridium butyricum]MBA8972471.1 K+/H+ antiporter YhaU regulatory subunit KhtT [Clostridium butyricum]MBC2429355.1 GntR family transcriptional regulator [Clostridium butyricum]NOW35666.1 K+/H+ antiporter YhaU regulatory subunit KhtT [Clostridium butyricum]
MNNLSIPTYKKIALDIANKIQLNNILEGDILHGRSTLSSKYNVSPETIRRSMILLEDVEVVKTIKGKGILVLSREKAISFLNRNKSIDSIRSYKTEIDKLLNNRKEIENQLLKSIQGIIDYSSRFNEVNNIIPLEFVVPENCLYIGKTVGEIMFWQNTGATLIAVKRNDELLLSPGPYISLNPNDILIVVGNDNIRNSVPQFLYPKNNL